MRKFLLVAAAMCLGLPVLQASAAILALDEFNYLPVGSPLSGHDGWGIVTNAALSPDPTIAAGSLNHPDRVPNAGNSAQLTGTGASGSSKLPHSMTRTTGRVYYSMLVNVSNITGLNDTAAGSFFAGFQPHTQVSPAVTSIATGGGNLLIHRDLDNANAYNLGVAASAGGAGNADRVFDTTEFAQGQTVFVVVAYQMNPGTNDDEAFLWLNPDPSTYGAMTPPAPDVTSNGALTAAADHGPVASFFLRNNGVEPDFTLVDDLRVATSWGQVTRLVVPEPAAVLTAVIGLGGLLLCKRRRI
jgi:hypothetical protein